MTFYACEVDANGEETQLGSDHARIFKFRSLDRGKNEKAAMHKIRTETYAGGYIWTRFNLYLTDEYNFYDESKWCLVAQRR